MFIINTINRFFGQDDNIDYATDATDDIITVKTNKLYTESSFCDVLTTLYKNIIVNKSNKIYTQTYEILLPKNINYYVNSNSNESNIYNDFNNKQIISGTNMFSSCGHNGNYRDNQYNILKKRLMHDLIGIKIISIKSNDIDTSIKINIDSNCIVDLPDSFESDNKYDDNMNIGKKIIFVEENKNLTIESHQTVVNNGVIYVDANATLNILGRLDNNGIIINIGTIIVGQNNENIQSGGIFVNNLIVYNKGRIDNLLNDYSISTINKKDNQRQISFTNNDISTLVNKNQSVVFNKCIFYSTQYSLIDNSSIILNDICGTFKNNGKVENTGAINNCGYIYNKNYGSIEYGEIYNHGDISNVGNIMCELLINHKNLHSYDYGKLFTTVTDNYGELANHSNCYYESNTINNNGVLLNNSKLEISTFNCYSYLHNNMHGLIMVTNFINLGRLTNDGSIVVYKNGSIENLGTIKNNKCGSITTNNMINRMIVNNFGSIKTSYS